MASKAKLRRKIKRLKKRELDLIIECNAARARAGEARETLDDAFASEAARLFQDEVLGWMTIRPGKLKLDG